MTTKTSFTQDKKTKQKRYDAAVYRLNISYLSQRVFGTFLTQGKTVKRQPDLSPKLEQLKLNILEALLQEQGHRKLQYWTIVWQIHQSNGLAHLDILLKYQKRIKKSKTSFDYLLALCPQDLQYFSLQQGQKPQVHLTAYAETRLNLAIVQYGQKQDPRPVSNFSPKQIQQVLAIDKVKADPFSYFCDIMQQDPYNFQLSYYAYKYNLHKCIKGWSQVKAKLNDFQAACRAMTQQKKPWIKPITRDLILARLSPQELQIYDQYQCFTQIITFINQIPHWRSHRPHKTPNLYIWGPPGIGKTSFLNQGPTNLAQLIPHYDINLQNKYLNRYYNNIYGFISWNQFKYTDFSPTWVLKLLEGLDLEIPIRYASNIKRDNPLVIATSNLSLTQQIERRWPLEPKLQQIAKSNLLNHRIVEVYVPVDMFFLQKLLIPAEDSDSQSSN